MDSRPDTYEHQHEVALRLASCIILLTERMVNHDRSKLHPPEREAYDQLQDIVSRKDVAYGSNEYKAMFDPIKPAIKHHFAHNAGHHPDAHDRGLRDMSLIDLLEMLCDWSAASLRHEGDFEGSIAISQKRYGFSDELADILRNTIHAMPILGSSVTALEGEEALADIYQLTESHQ